MAHSDSRQSALAIASQRSMGGEQKAGATVAVAEQAEHQLIELCARVKDLSEGEEHHILAVSEDCDLAGFELKCRIFAKHSRQHELKHYLASYNRVVGKNGWRPIEYTSHAHHMADIGLRFLDSDKSMMRDYWALPKSYFAEALAAGDKFFVALDMAQERVEARIRDGDAPTFTIAEFRQSMQPPAKGPEPTPGESKKSERKVPTSELSKESSEEPRESELPEEPETEAPLPSLLKRAREELGEEEVQAVLERALSGESQPPIDIEGQELLREGRDADVRAAACQRTCYDCRSCHELGANQRLAAVVVAEDGTTITETLGVFEPCSTWFCAPKRQLISVRTQQFERAQAIAKMCGDFHSRFVAEEGEEPSEDEELQDEDCLTVEEFMAAERIPQ